MTGRFIFSPPWQPDAQKWDYSKSRMNDDRGWSFLYIDVERMNVWLRISRILSMKLLEFLLDNDISRNYLNLSLIWCLHYYYALCIAREIIVLKPNNLKPPNFITSINKHCCPCGLDFSRSFLLDIPPKLNPIIS